MKSNNMYFSQEIISKDVRSAEIYNLQGMCFYGLDSPVNAMESYKKALEIDSGCLDALKGFCRCLINADENQVSHQVLPHINSSLNVKLL